VEIGLLLLPTIETEWSRTLKPDGIAIVKCVRLVNALLLSLPVRVRTLALFELRQPERSLPEDPLLAVLVCIGVGPRRGRLRALRQLRGILRCWRSSRLRLVGVSSRPGGHSLLRHCGGFARFLRAGRLRVGRSQAARQQQESAAEGGYR